MKELIKSITCTYCGGGNSLLKSGFR